jgi:hypothetical protein
LTAEPLSMEVLPEIEMVGGAAFPVQEVPEWQLTVGGAISSDPEGRASPPVGHCPVPAVQVKADA